MSKITCVRSKYKQFIFHIKPNTSKGAQWIKETVHIVNILSLFINTLCCRTQVAPESCPLTSRENLLDTNLQRKLI